jgi:[acyl-carrier-protein] S-malonyltransferase
MLAFVFPGQGAQKVGMGRAFATAFPLARQTFEQADDALGFSISQICFEGPDDALARTANSQPAIVAASVAVLRVVQAETGLVPEVVAGHSLGEYSALVCAGALAFEDAVRLVHKRGLFMQQAVPEGQGAMAAVIGLDVETITDLCLDAARDQVVTPANVNGGGQVVIAGHAQAVQRAMVAAKQQGARAVPLRVSAPFHCPLMAPAAEQLAAELARVRFADPQMPVVANVLGVENVEGAAIAELLEQQVTATVQWEKTVRRMVDIGVTETIELGPGKVLSGLIKRIAKGTLTTTNVEEPGQIATLPRREQADEVQRRRTA